MHLYGLILGIAIVLGIDFFTRHQNVIPKKRENIFIIGTLISALFGARIYHVIDKWPYYSQNLSQIPATWQGGLGIFGGILGALIFIVLFINPKSYILNLLNSITPILPLCQAIGRLGNFANHENPFWWPEAILDLFLFLFIQKFPQNPTAKYLIGYGLIRFFTEFGRSETWVYHSIKIGQLISLVFIITGIILICNNYSKNNHKFISLSSNK